MTDKLFLCGTQYHVLQAAACLLAAPCFAEIGLSQSIPGREELAARLKKSGLFQAVHTPQDFAWPAPVDTNVPLFHLRQRLGIRRTGWKVSPSAFREIILYNDWTPFGRWLQDCGAHYVLGEDTRSHLDHPNYHIDGQKQEADFEQRQKSGRGYLYWGAYKGVDAVEAAAPDQVEYYREKLRSFDLFALLESFGPEQRAVLRQIFIQQDLPEIDGPTCLLLPRSFYVDKDLPSQEAQDRLVKDTAARYCQGYRLFIKTHPRDTADYQALFPEAIVLDRFMPSELLDYCFDVRFARAVGLCTASVRNLRCADEKISLDYDYIAPYQA